LTRNWTGQTADTSSPADGEHRWTFISAWHPRLMTQPQNLTSEDREMASVEAELADEFRDVDPHTIHTLVAEGYASLTPAKVTSFLPILVIRRVQTRLRLDAA